MNNGACPNKRKNHRIVKKFVGELKYDNSGTAHEIAASITKLEGVAYNCPCAGGLFCHAALAAGFSVSYGNRGGGLSVGRSFGFAGSHPDRQLSIRTGCCRQSDGDVAV